ncbi:MAG: hypothetical protein Q4G34_01120 [Micrococcus sp.]|nr:hypothetical protein [Micrococcus sp.]
MNLASTAFGALLAETARPMSLIDSIQTVTQAARIDMTEHEIWLIQNAAEDAPGILFESYGQLIGMMERSAMGQEHHIVVRWPLSSEFLERASHLGPQHAGWLELMNAEIAKVTRRLNRSKLGSARPLTARELTAVIRHMQMPSWPRGDLSGIDPDEIGLPYDEGARSYVVTEDLNPQGEVEQWLHRTAEVTAKRLESEQFDALWLMPILSALPEQIQRTVSTHITTRPAGAARRDARYDLTLDTAEMREQRRKGQILDDTLNAEHKAAQVRHMDLRPNTGIQGAGWAMHITISARSLPELRKARDIITQGCSDAGIASLDWLDSHHGAAMSWTWPIGRGMTMYKPTATARMLSTLSARDQGDSL